MLIINSTFQSKEIAEQIKSFYYGNNADETMDEMFNINDYHSSVDIAMKLLHDIKDYRNEVFYRPKSKGVIITNQTTAYVVDIDKNAVVFIISEEESSDFPSVTFAYEGKHTYYQTLFNVNSFIKELLKKSTTSIVELDFNPRYGLKSWEGIKNCDLKNPIVVEALKKDASKLIKDGEVKITTDDEIPKIIADGINFDIVNVAFTPDELNIIAKAYAILN